MSKITRRCGVRDIAPSTHSAFSRPNPSTLPSWVSTSVSNRLMVLVLAAGLTVSNDYPHRRIVGQPFSIVGILVACQTTVHRLPEKAHQPVRYDRPDSPADIHVSVVPVHHPARDSQQQSEVMVAPKLQPLRAKQRGTGVGAFPIGASRERYQDLKQSITTSLALMITTVLCYSATSGSSVADCGKPCRVDMGNVG